MTWWRRLWHREQMEEQLDKELNFHLEQHVSDLIARGHNPEEARRMARLALGGPEQVKELCRDARGTRWLEDLLRDVRYAVRSLCQRPGFATVALCTLALGTGATTVMLLPCWRAFSRRFERAGSTRRALYGRINCARIQEQLLSIGKRHVCSAGAMRAVLGLITVHDDNRSRFQRGLAESIPV